MSAENIKFTLMVACVAGVLIGLGVAANRGRYDSAIAPFLWLAEFRCRRLGVGNPFVDLAKVLAFSRE